MPAKMKLPSFILLIGALSSPWAMAVDHPPRLVTDHTPQKFTVSQSISIPGVTLKPGDYSIHVVDHLWERYVLHVDGPKTGIHLTFLAIENPQIPQPAKPGEVDWSNTGSGTNYMRGWLFPGVPGVLEFVYPKAEAVAIAKTNAAKVPAIDPVSEGRPGNLADLSKTDREEITLWLLTETQVGPGDTAEGIKAERYPEVAAAARKPAIARLPQTASTLPLLFASSVLAFVAAFTMRTHRLAAVNKSRSKSREKGLC